MCAALFVYAMHAFPFSGVKLPDFSLTADLVVDTYLDEVVRSLEQQGLTDEAEEVEIHQDGHWEPILEDQKARHRLDTTNRPHVLLLQDCWCWCC